MNRKLFLKLLWTTVFFSPGRVSHAGENAPALVPLLVSDPINYPESKRFRIKRPGKYFLTQDHIQRATYFDSEGRKHKETGGGSMIPIFCGMVELDFRGHVIATDVAMAGVTLYAADNVGAAKTLSRPASLDNRNVVLRNGTIDLTHGNHFGNAIDFVEFWRGRNKRNIGRPDDGGGKLLSVKYKENNYRFEDLKVFSNDVALTAEGTNTIIRNCIIESSDMAVVFLAGNNVLIENCEIRLKKPQNRSSYPRAAIVLRDGSHSVIRNNRIRVDYGDGDESKTYCILVRDGATNVLIENNTFVNVKGDTVTATDGSDVILRKNTSDTVWF